MKTAIKNKWVKALRSGNYKQTTGALMKKRTDGKMGFCCLGVLCDIYIKEKNKKWDSDGSGGYELYNEGGTLPEKVMKWAGLEDANPDVDSEKKGYHSLATFNDGCSLRFKTIATIIEKGL